MGRLTRFSVTNLLCIYDYILKSCLTVGTFDIFTFSIVLCFFSRHRIEVFPVTHNLWEINIV